MAKSYPDKIPTEYADNETLADAYTRGWNHGHGFACHNVPRLGDKIWSDSLGRVTVDAENIREVHAANCWQAEDGSRCYSPFEFTAHEFNEYGEGGDGNLASDDVWEAFEEGTGDAIAADLAEYTDEDYGIENDAEEEEEL